MQIYPKCNTKKRYNLQNTNANKVPKSAGT